ncbi:MAG: hypothetical protein ACK559_22025 [bacterium]
MVLAQVVGDVNLVVDPGAFISLITLVALVVVADVAAHLSCRLVCVPFCFPPSASFASSSAASFASSAGGGLGGIDVAFLLPLGTPGAAVAIASSASYEQAFILLAEILG